MVPFEDSFDDVFKIFITISSILLACIISVPALGAAPFLLTILFTVSMVFWAFAHLFLRHLMPDLEYFTKLLAWYFLIYYIPLLLILVSNNVGLTNIGLSDMYSITTNLGIWGTLAVGIMLWVRTRIRSKGLFIVMGVTYFISYCLIFTVLNSL